MRWHGLFAVTLAVACGCGDNARSRTQSLNNLHNLGIAVHNDASANRGAFMIGTERGEDGAAMHGWPTQLLAPVDQTALKRQIDSSKPWDDPVNVPTMQVAVPVYLYPGQPTHDEQGFALIHYAANEHVVGDHPAVMLDDVNDADGLRSTILLGEVSGSPKPWGHPENHRDPGNGLSNAPNQFGSPSGSESAVVQFLFCDGSARAINPNVDPAVLKALGTWNGGEDVPDEYR